jgi:hypothetical protein
MASGLHKESAGGESRILPNSRITANDKMSTSTAKLQNFPERKQGIETMRTNLATVLDPNRRSNDARDFETALRRKIVGQDQAIEKVAEIYQMFLAGLNAPGRPVGNLLFLGPTGSGKTRVVEAVAESLFGDSRGLHQDRLRRVPALARDCQADRLASGIPGTSRDASAADAGSAQPVAHGKAEALDPAVRRNREGFRLALAVAAGNSGQSDADARR